MCQVRDESCKTASGGKKKAGTFGIIASGPSACKKDAQSLKEICDQVIAVNDSWRLLPSCDHLYGTDYKFWNHWIETITKDFDGNCWTQNINWPNDQKPEAWGITCLEGRVGAAGLSRNPKVLHTGENSGYAAINLAFHLGAKRIILIGFDMSKDGEKSHWFGEHPEEIRLNSNYGDFLRNFATIHPEQYGIEIWNCTRRTALRCFPLFDLDEVCAALS